MTSKAKIRKAYRFHHVIRAMDLKKQQGTHPRFLEPQEWYVLNVHTRKFFYCLKKVRS